MPFDNVHHLADVFDTFNEKCCFAIEMLHSLQDFNPGRISPALTLYVKNLILRNNWRRIAFYNILKMKIIYDVLKSI